MKLENQVATREQCEKLNDLMDRSEDIKTAFYWRYPTNKWVVEPEGYFNPNEEGVEWFPAYSVAELGLMLPRGYDTMQVTGEKNIGLWGGYDDNSANFPCDEYFNTEAQCRAEMLILCLLDERSTPVEVNARLNEL